jgi:hypothetical protein
MESGGIIPTVLAGMGMVAAVLLGVWGIVARYDSRVRDRMDAQGEETAEQLGQLRDRMDAQGKETAGQLGQLRERMAKLEGLLEGLREAITGKRAA